MRFFYPLALILMSITTSLVAQNPDPASSKRISLVEQLQAETKALQRKAPYSTGAQIAKLIQANRAAKGKGGSRNARIVPEWLYSEGRTDVFENGQRLYYVERLVYTNPNEYTITVDYTDVNGQVLSTIATGYAKFTHEDTLVYSLQTRHFGGFREAFYDKLFYNEELDVYQPVSEKSYLYDGALTTTRDVRHHYNRQDGLIQEVIVEKEGMQAGLPVYVGGWMKSYSNGNAFFYRSDQKGNWEDDEKSIITRTGQQQEQIISISLGQGQWVELEKYVTFFNNNEQMVEQIHLTSDGNELVGESRTVYAYQQNNLVLTEQYEPVTNGPGWQLTKQEERTYNQAQQLETVISSQANATNPSVFRPSVKNTYTYYPAGNPAAGKTSEVLNYIYGEDNWVPFTKFSYNYTAIEEFYSSTVEYFVMGQWQKESEETYEVDNRTLLVLENRMDYEDGAIKDSYQKTYTYIRSSTVSSSAEEALLSGKTLTAFPNPVQETLNLRLHLAKASAINVTFLNQAGQTIKSEKLALRPTGTHLIALPVQDLQPGIYFCQVQTQDGVQTRKIVKN